MYSSSVRGTRTCHGLEGELSLRCLDTLMIAPGNPGTARLGENIPITAEDDQGVAALLDFAREMPVDLVMVGPEAPLAAGLVRRAGRSRDRGLWATQAAAQIEDLQSVCQGFHEPP